jgi:outer membrane protein assembly factor BamB
VDVLHEGGKPAVITFYRLPQPNGQEGVLEVRDAATGEVIWSRRLGHLPQNPVGSTIERFLVGPDLNGDGWRDLFVTTISERDGGVVAGKSVLYVDAFSGRDGRPLWWSRVAAVPVKHAVEAKGAEAGGPRGPLGPMHWWQTGSDGLPLLLVSCLDRNDQWQSYALVASTGRVEHSLPGFGPVGVADLNRDGIPDVYGLIEEGNRLQALRGVPPEPWRLLGGRWQPAQDFEVDGIADLIDSSDPKRTAVVSGKDGRRLWQVDVGGVARVVTPLPDGDLDGDGVPDVLVAEEQRSQASEFELHALSGRTGARLWNCTVAVADDHVLELAGSPPPYLSCHSLRAGDPPDVLFGYFARLKPGAFRGKGPNQPGLEYWMARISGRDGKVLWNVPLSDDKPFDAGYRIQPPALADLDGDGILDLVLWVHDTGTHRTDRLRAFSGRDGKPLWEGPIIHRLDIPACPRPAVCDVAGVRRVLVFAPVNNATGWELLALDGKDGKARWRRHLRNGAPFGPAWLTATPPLVRLDTGPAVCVNILDSKDGEQLVLLDVADGKVVPWQDRQRFGRLPPPAAIADLDGQGKDDGVFVHEGKVLATRGGFKDIRWSWPLPGQGTALLEVRPARQDKSAAVVVVDSGGAVYGLDGQTGRPRWRCETVSGPGWDGPVVLGAEDAETLPLLLFKGKSTVVCRRALPTGPTGECLRPAPRPRTDGPAPDDPRLLRLLPWRTASIAPNLDRSPEVQWVLLGLGLVVLGFLVFWAWRRRSGRLGLLPVAWLGVLGLWFYLLNTSDATRRDSERLAAFLLVWLPLLLFVGVLFRLLWRQRWWRALLVVAFALVAALAVASWWLAQDAEQMGPAEYYSTAGWYTVLPLGAYVMGSLFLGMLVLRGLLGKWLRRQLPAWLRPSEGN